MTPVDEKQLIEMLSDPATQRKAFEQVVRQYSEQLYWHVRRIVLTHEDANDVMQNVMLKAWANIDSFRKDAKISTWLYRIAVNESLDFVRRQKHLSDMSVDDMKGVAGTLMADQYFDGDETEAQLQEAVAQLPEVQRTVFTLRYYEEMKYSEMSKILNTSEGSLKASYHFAVKKISDFFKQRD
ncbi:MAG: sigma-70 family RNA polymerase sigma factor [Prevotella sp.]|nr:sigma-70 family RNA polymerase sigma factor [Prevotella sp.]